MAAPEGLMFEQQRDRPARMSARPANVFGQYSLESTVESSAAAWSSTSCGRITFIENRG